MNVYACLLQVVCCTKQWQSSNGSYFLGMYVCKYFGHYPDVIARTLIAVKQINSHEQAK